MQFSGHFLGLLTIVLLFYFGQFVDIYSHQFTDSPLPLSVKMFAAANCVHGGPSGSNNGYGKEN